MTTRPPTPQAISALLRKAGFERAEWGKNRCTREGYQASLAFGAVRVEWVQPFGARPDPGRRSVILSDYATALIAASWQARRMESHVIVTAREDSQ